MAAIRYFEREVDDPSVSSSVRTKAEAGDLGGDDGDPDEQLPALNDFDVDAVVDDAKRRKAQTVRIQGVQWDQAIRSWKTLDP